MFNKLYFNENISLPILWFGLVFEMCIFHSVWTSKDLGKSAEDEMWSKNRTFTPAESFLIPNFWVQISARKCDWGNRNTSTILYRYVYCYRPFLYLCWYHAASYDYREFKFWYSWMRFIPNCTLGTGAFDLITVYSLCYAFTITYFVMMTHQTSSVLTLLRCNCGLLVISCKRYKSVSW